MGFELPVDEEEGYFDLLISQYSGFVSRYCARYLKPGGLLLANDSHGDATWAYMSGDFTFRAAIFNRGEIAETGLDSYFRLAKNKAIDIDSVLSTMKGPAYTLTADAGIHLGVVTKDGDGFIFVHGLPDQGRCDMNGVKTAITVGNDSAALEWTAGPRERIWIPRLTADRRSWTVASPSSSSEPITGIVCT